MDVAAPLETGPLDPGPEGIDEVLVDGRDGAAVEHVVAAAAFQDAGARAADQHVVAGAGHEDVVARAAVEEHAALDRRIDLDLVVAEAAHQRDALHAAGHGELHLADEGSRVQVVQRRQELVRRAGDAGEVDVVVGGQAHLRELAVDQLGLDGLEQRAWSGRSRRPGCPAWRPAGRPG